PREICRSASANPFWPLVNRIAKSEFDQGDDMNSTITRLARTTMLLLAGFAFAACMRVEAQPKTPPGTTPAGGQPTTQPGTAPAGGPSTINQTPFFNAPEVRQHLNLTNNQYQGMNQAYQNAWSTYQKGINNIDPNWSAVKRQQAMQDLQ